MKKISSKMLVVLIPVICVVLCIMLLVSANNATTMLKYENGNYMRAELEAKCNSIDASLGKVLTKAEDNAAIVAKTYQSMTLSQYEELFKALIEENELVLGSGIWFEPQMYDKNKTYVGPYIYKENNLIKATYDYSNASYDYFSQEYYKHVKENKNMIITDPYYDETTNKMISTCAVPIIDGGKFIGVISVDIELSSIQKKIQNIKVGKKGAAKLVTKEGAFIAEDNTSQGKKADKNLEQTLSDLGKKIAKSKTDRTTYRFQNQTYNVYIRNVSLTGWKLLLQIPQAELDSQVNILLLRLSLIGLIAILVIVGVIIVLVHKIARQINDVTGFAEKLSQGDFSISEITIRSKDEIGRMGNALNVMYRENKKIITNINTDAITIDQSSERLSDASTELYDQFQNVEKYMSEVNESMMTASAATEELNASAEEVKSSIDVLDERIMSSNQWADAMQQRAVKVRKDSQISFETANEISEDCRKNLRKSLENAKIVDNISEMAQVISGIAQQINLLSLNASIEAARAGEHGKGFAVVASEVGKLAGETNDAVTNIQQMIQDVQSAFEHLIQDAHSLLDFVVDTVAPDYQSFVEVGEHYGEDANRLSEIFEAVSALSDQIEHIMGEISVAVSDIAETSQKTADNSSQVLDAVETVSGEVEEITEMSKKQKNIAGELKEVVLAFRL